MSDQPTSVTELLERNRERVEPLCRYYGVYGDDAVEVLVAAGREVLLRTRPGGDADGRFVRAVERRCRGHFERHGGEHRRALLDLFGGDGPGDRRAPEEGGEEGAGGGPGGAEERR